MIKEIDYKDEAELTNFVKYIQDIKESTKSEKMQTFYSRLEHHLIEKIIDLKENRGGMQTPPISGSINP